MRALGNLDVLPLQLREAAERAPSTPVLEQVEGGTLTYRELHESALRWAAALARLGVTAEDPVVTMLPPRNVAFEAWLGIGWLRAIEVPVNTMFRATMLSYVVDHSTARIAVVGRRFLPTLLEVAPALHRLETVVVVDDDGERQPDAPDSPPDAPWRLVDAAQVLRESDPVERPAPGPHDIACMIYTSGTTGPSKGVLMQWRELDAFALAAPRGFVGEGDAYYSAMPVFHASGKSSLCLAVRGLGRVVLREHFSVSAFWDDVRRHRCATAGMVGVMAMMLLRQPPAPGDADHPLRRVMLGPLFPDIAEFCRRFGVKVTTGYGMTEIGAPLGAAGYDVTLWRSCGQVRPHYELRIVDEHDEEVAVGDVGELVVRSDQPWLLNAGYWRMPEATAAAWRNGWFHTGDAFRRDVAGNFYFVDRMKDAIRRRGENISSLELESLVMQHPDIAAAAAFGVDADLGEQEAMVVVVRQPGSSITEVELADDLSKTLPSFMLPRYVEFADELPQTQTMRVRKVELRERGVTDRTWDRDARTPCTVPAAQPQDGAM